MADQFTRETFFRPEIHCSLQGTLPATIYNALQLLISRSDTGSVFIPIRTMQYQAVGEREEVIFVDSQGGYAHRDGVGGRLIRIAWRPQPAGQRTSLSEPVPCEVIHYFPGLRETQWRLISEIQPVLRTLIRKQKDAQATIAAPRVVPLVYR